MAGCGMEPITVNREIEGFILNRLQFAVLNEAFRLIAEGYVSAEDLDKTIKDGLALRWSFMGPIETIDLNAPDGIADAWRAMAAPSAASASSRRRPSHGPIPLARHLMPSGGHKCRVTSSMTRQPGATGA